MKRLRRSFSRLVRTSGGFTLVELSTVAVLASFVAGMAFLAIVYVQRGLARWEAHTRLSQEVHQWHRTLAHDVRRAHGVRVEPDGYTLDGPAGAVSYRVAADARWHRDGVPLHTRGTEARMDLVPDADDGGGALVRTLTILVEMHTAHARVVHGSTVRLAPAARWHAPPGRAPP